MRRTKRMRLPNGFGQICFLKGNHRKPYRAMVTVGTNEKGRPICKILKPQGYFESYNDAYMALMEYHKNPNDFTEITLGEIFEKWSEENFPRLQNNTIGTYKTSWSHLKPIKDVKISEFRSRNIKEFLMRDSISESAASLIKVLLNQLYDYAVENEYIDKNYSRNVNIRSKSYKVIKGHRSFTDEEIKQIWSNSNISIAKYILIQCYTGMRPNELLSIRLENINLDDGYIIGGSKTEAGRNRRIPIHSCVKDLIIENINIAKQHGCDYLITGMRGGRLQYRLYAIRFNNFLNNLFGENSHTPHDCRKFFVTTAKKYKLDEYAIKLIVGHHIPDITERIYTERPVDWLKTEMEKIKVYE